LISLFPQHHSFKVDINPSSFSTNISNSSFCILRKDWFLNLSSATIPEESQCLLQLGENFSLPTINLEKIIEVIKNIENNTNKFSIEIQLIIRNRIIPIINNLTSTTSYNDSHSNKISQLAKKTKLFSKNNPNILFTKADKRNCRVRQRRIQIRSLKCFKTKIHVA